MDKIEQKEIAVSCLEKLDIYKPYINDHFAMLDAQCCFILDLESGEFTCEN